MQARILRDPDVRRKGPERAGGHAAAAQAGNREHSRIAPAVDQAILDELDQLPFAHDRVGDVQAGELDLARERRLQLERT